MGSALSQPGCTPRAPTGSAAQVQEPREPTQLCRLGRAALAEGQPRDAGLVLTGPERKITCVSLHICASVFSLT